MASRVLGYLIVAVACLAIGLVIGTQVIRAAESTGTNRSSFGIGGASGPSTNNLAAAQATGAAITQGLSAVGEATVKAQPDLAILNIGVQSQADTAQAAQDDNNQKMQAVIDALKGAGIAAEDIRTSGLSLHPVHDERGQITRYQANNSVVVTIH